MSEKASVSIILCRGLERAEQEKVERLDSLAWPIRKLRARPNQNARTLSASLAEFIEQATDPGGLARRDRNHVAIDPAPDEPGICHHPSPPRNWTLASFLTTPSPPSISPTGKSTPSTPNRIGQNGRSVYTPSHRPVAPIVRIVMPIASDPMG
jgi:hypothetical protein